MGYMAMERDQSRDQPVTRVLPAENLAQHVVERLEEAGRALLSMPPTGYSTRITISRVLFAPEPGESGLPTPPAVRITPPSSQEISRMDEALEWLALIPNRQRAIRRIVAARALKNPVTDKHLYSWRDIGRIMNIDHKAVQRWHSQGIEIITRALWRAGFFS